MDVEKSITEKVIRVHRSLAEADAADAADARARAELTSQQRVEIFFELRERVYPNAAQQGLARVGRVIGGWSSAMVDTWS